MVYIKPTYEEYCMASSFAKIRYRYGVYIQLISVILLLFLVIYTVINIEEMKANPKDYAEDKLGVICNLPIIFQPITNDYGGNRNITNT